MLDAMAVPSVDRHNRVVAVAALAGGAVMAGFRLLIELGLGSGGSLRVFGLPLEYAYLAWFLVLGALPLDRRRLAGAARLRSTVFDWVWAVVGLAGTMWLIRELGPRRFGLEAWVYPFGSACVLAVFLSASTIQRDASIQVAKNVLPDAFRLLRRPATWAAALAALVILGAGPRSGETPSDGAAFRRWYSRQPRQEVPPSWAVGPVTLVELVDYQCPACRAAATRYRDVISKAEQQYGDAFRFVRIDFPLDSECNPLTAAPPPREVHPAACEAAAAVRLARSKGPEMERKVIEWLWAHQKELTREVVFDGIAKQFDIDAQGQYDQLLVAIRRDATEGRSMRVTGTPTYFMNGRQLPLLAANTLEAAIGIEIEHAKAVGQRARR